MNVTNFFLSFWVNEARKFHKWNHTTYLLFNSKLKQHKYHLSFYFVTFDGCVGVFFPTGMGIFDSQTIYSQVYAVVFGSALAIRSMNLFLCSIESLAHIWKRSREQRERKRQKWKLKLEFLYDIKSNGPQDRR